METILIRNVVEKESKAGRKYYSVETDKGNMTAFDKEIIEGLKRNVGKEINAEIKESNGFKNIRSFDTIKTEKIGSESQSAPSQVSFNKDQFAEARKEKNVAFYVSYAKDIFCTILATSEETKDLDLVATMKSAVDLVKQAIKEFEEKSLATGV